jgi:hypothetical protein
MRDPHRVLLAFAAAAALTTAAGCGAADEDAPSPSRGGGKAAKVTGGEQARRPQSAEDVRALLDRHRSKQREELRRNRISSARMRKLQIQIGLLLAKNKALLDAADKLPGVLSSRFRPTKFTDGKNPRPGEGAVHAEDGTVTVYLRDLAGNLRTVSVSKSSPAPKFGPQPKDLSKLRKLRIPNRPPKVDARLKRRAHGERIAAGRRISKEKVERLLEREDARDVIRMFRPRSR